MIFRFFSESFEHEIHPRLRFTHRGLVGMANNGEKDTNDSQVMSSSSHSKRLKLKVRALVFYHTWYVPSSYVQVDCSTILSDRADELHGKHTLFGRCVGDTIFSA